MNDAASLLQLLLVGHQEDEDDHMAGKYATTEEVLQHVTDDDEGRVCLW